MTRWCPICVPWALAAVALIGCGQRDGPGSPIRRRAVDNERLLPFRDVADAADRNPRDFILVVRLKITTVQLPVGSVSDSERLWSYLDEEPVGSRMGSALAYNGIRIGLGSKEAWGDVDAILRRLTGRPLAGASALAPAGVPMPIVFKPGLGAQTIFTYRPDYTLFGRDYPPGDNVVMTMATIDYDDPSAVHLTGAFAVRHARRRRRYKKQPLGLAIVSEDVYEPLDELGFQFNVAVGSFVVIGPARGVRRKSSPGRHFLIHERKGLEFETVVIISPQILAAPVRKPG